MLWDDLNDFRYKYKVVGRGALALVVQLTRDFSMDSLPIDPEHYVTDKQGQVAGLSGAKLGKILAEHGIMRQLAKEGGRTNRGNMALMHEYVSFINRIEGPVDFQFIEEYWIQRVREFLAGRPFRLTRDSSRSIADAVDDLLRQAAKRQKEQPGMQYAGSVLQHLVAAKLELLMPTIEIHGASDADEQTGREGDFIIGDSAVHCTTAPTNLLIQKCASNLRHGLNPIIVTIANRTAAARALLEDAGIGNRVEVWDLQQFLSINVYEHGKFTFIGRRDILAGIIEIYNGIIDEFETDPSLRIEYDV